MYSPTESGRPASVTRNSPHTIADWVAERIRNDIRDGTLQPGARLLQDEVAQSLNVSTTPVREAFAILKSEGIVQGDRHRGAIVFSPTLDDVIEINAIRDVLENLAVEQAFPNYTPELRKRLKAQLDAMEASEGTPTYGDIHREYHKMIFVPSGSPRLVNLIAGLREPMTVLRAGTIPEWANREALESREHRQIYQAITRGDKTKLLRLLYLHRGAADLEHARPKAE
jgi:DNA-binding GntR family transcriptional regulator